MTRDQGHDWACEEDYMRLLEKWKQQSDPDARRNAREAAEARAVWLREHHTEPLLARARDVLGDDAPRLLKAARSRLSEAHIRFILRKCVELPTESRRVAYFRKCIKQFRPEEQEPPPEDPLDWLDDDEIRALTPEDWKEIRVRRRAQIEFERSPYDKLEKLIGPKQAWTLHLQLMDVLCKRFPHESDDQQIDRIVRLFASAIEKRHPARWLRVVIKDQRAQLRKRHKQKRGPAP